MALLLAGAAIAQAPGPAPPPLASLAARALPGGKVAAWCEGRSGPGADRWHAAAVKAERGGGKYIVTVGPAGFLEAGAFDDTPDLHCYTAQEARNISQAMAESEGMNGDVKPVNDGTVVCAFVQPTRAECWQYAPATRSLVRVGELTT